MASSSPRNALSKTTAAATTAARSTAHAASGTAAAAARAVALAPTVALNAALSPSLTGLLLLVLTTRGGPSFVRDARARLERLLSGGIGGGGGVVRAVEARRRVARATDVLKVLFAVGVARVLNAVLNRWAMQQWRWKRPAVGLGGGAGRVAAREKNPPVLWDFDGKRGVGEVVVVTGGCGGIGKEIVMGLVEGEKGGGRGVEGVKVVVLDVVDLPPELEGRECFFIYLFLAFFLVYFDEFVLI